jgi:hypothetical protein
MSVPTYITALPRCIASPLYLIVSKLRPIRFGRRKVLRSVSHVPSPTYIVLEEYVLLPGGVSSGLGDIFVIAPPCPRDFLDTLFN